MHAALKVLFIASFGVILATVFNGEKVFDNVLSHLACMYILAYGGAFFTVASLKLEERTKKA